MTQEELNSKVLEYLDEVDSDDQLESLEARVELARMLIVLQTSASEALLRRIESLEYRLLAVEEDINDV